MGSGRCALPCGEFQNLANSAAQGNLTDMEVFNASIDAAIDTGSVGAFYGINAGYEPAKMIGGRKEDSE